MNETTDVYIRALGTVGPKITRKHDWSSISFVFPEDQDWLNDDRLLQNGHTISEQTVHDLHQKLDDYIRRKDFR